MGGLEKLNIYLKEYLYYYLMNNNMKTKFLSNGNVELSINNYLLIVSCEQINKINEIKNWYYDETKFDYPYYIIKSGSDGKCKITEYLYGEFIELDFKDNNKNNLTENNVIINDIKHYINDYVVNNYNVNKYIQGHISKNIIYNPIWMIISKDYNQVYYLMYCEKNVLIKLTAYELDLLDNFNKKNNCNLTWFYVNSKGESIKARFNKSSINIVHIIKSFGKSCIIKINNDIINNNSKNNIINDMDDEIINNTSNTNIINDIDEEIIIENNKLSLKELTELKLNKIDDKLNETMNVINIYRGHINYIGVHAGVEKNRIWEIQNENKIIYLMYCEPDDLCILDEKSLNIIRKYEKEIKSKITWFKHSNNYIMGTAGLYIHQMITGYHGNGKGTMGKSVDHIDRNPLNNCFDNLKIATREEQQENTKSVDGERKARSKSAKPLPDGITNDMMKKYIVYYKECYNKEKGLYREFFKIEKHPKLEKPWIGSKSNKISILDKLKEANHQIDLLN